jgi:hypothetical protein
VVLFLIVFVVIQMNVEKTSQAPKNGIYEQQQTYFTG